MFQWLTRKTWQRQLRRADRLIARGDPHGALPYLNAALDLFDGDPHDIGPIHDRLSETHGALRRLYLEEAEQRLVSGHRDRAARALAHAQSHDASASPAPALTARFEALARGLSREGEVEGVLVDVNEPFVVVHELTDPVRGEMLVGYLQNNGFPARLIGTRNAALIGVGQMIVPVRVEVPRSRAGEAFLLIDQLEGGDAAERGKLSVVDPMVGDGKISTTSEG